MHKSDCEKYYRRLYRWLHHHDTYNSNLKIKNQNDKSLDFIDFHERKTKNGKYENKSENDLNANTILFMTFNGFGFIENEFLTLGLGQSQSFRSHYNE